MVAPRPLGLRPHDADRPPPPPRRRPRRHPPLAPRRLARLRPRRRHARLRPPPRLPPPRAFGPLRHARRYAQWWALGAAGAVLTLALYVALFKSAGKLDDLSGAYSMRSAGGAPLERAIEGTGFWRELRRVLDARRYWIELSFSPIAIALGKAAAVLVALRLLVLRREHEVLPLAVLLMAAVQYVVFKQGADIHVFWPQYFGAYFALAMGAVVATLAPLFSYVRPLGRERGPVLALGVALLPILAIARDGIPALRYARETGGRFNEKGLLIHSDGAKTAFLHFIEPTLPRSGTIGLHEGMKPTWARRGRSAAAGSPATAPARPRARRRRLPRRHALPPRRPPGPARPRLPRHRRRALLEGGPGRACRAHRRVRARRARALLVGVVLRLRHGAAPRRRGRPLADVGAAHVLRAGGAVPTTPPVTLDQKRIAHNAALAAGDAPRAAALVADIERELRPVHAAFDDGTEIVGTTFHEGARDLLTIFVEAGGPTTGDVQLAVKSKVTARAAWSTTMADPLDRDVGIPLAIPPQRWKKGFLYSDPVAIRKRPGTEVYRAYFWVRGAGVPPRRLGGPKDVDLVTLR